MSSEKPREFGQPQILVREFKHWTLLLSPSSVVRGALILIDRESAPRISSLSGGSLREMLTIVDKADSALVRMLGCDRVNCVWSAPPGREIQVNIVPRYDSSVDPAAQSIPHGTCSALPLTLEDEALDPTDMETLATDLRDHFSRRCEISRKFARVYTTGCFDLFHVGHLNIIRGSKAVADHLVVGVSTDELIEMEKSVRPSVPLDDRMAIVAAIKYVDEVIPQTDKNKQRIVDEYDIDAITVGDDWKGRYPSVTCELVYFPYTTNTSSSRLKGEIASALRQ